MTNLSPEGRARENIDSQLKAVGWAVQGFSKLNLSAARGVAGRDRHSRGVLTTSILFVESKVLGIIESKKDGTALPGVAELSNRYFHSRKWIPTTLHFAGECNHAENIAQIEQIGA